MKRSAELTPFMYFLSKMMGASSRIPVFSLNPFNNRFAVNKFYSFPTTIESGLGTSGSHDWNTDVAPNALEVQFALTPVGSPEASHEFDESRYFFFRPAS
jgi:hypothetical protein